MYNEIAGMLFLSVSCCVIPKTVKIVTLPPRLSLSIRGRKSELNHALIVAMLLLTTARKFDQFYFF